MIIRISCFRPCDVYEEFIYCLLLSQLSREQQFKSVFCKPLKYLYIQISSIEEGLIAWHLACSQPQIPKTYFALLKLIAMRFLNSLLFLHLTLFLSTIKKHWTNMKLNFVWKSLNQKKLCTTTCWFNTWSKLRQNSWTKLVITSTIWTVIRQCTHHACSNCHVCISGQNASCAEAVVLHFAELTVGFLWKHILTNV